MLFSEQRRQCYRNMKKHGNNAAILKPNLMNTIEMFYVLPLFASAKSSSVFADG